MRDSDEKTLTAKTAKKGQPQLTAKARRVEERNNTRAAPKQNPRIAKLDLHRIRQTLTFAICLTAPSAERRAIVVGQQRVVRWHDVVSK